MEQNTESLLVSYAYDAEQIYSNKKYSSPQRGAYISALTKRYKRTYLAGEMRDLMGSKDITTTAAMHIFKEIMGRGVSNRFLLKVFGTPNRTAANKSAIFEERLGAEIDFLKEKLSGFEDLLMRKRNQVAKEVFVGKPDS